MARALGIQLVGHKKVLARLSRYRVVAKEYVRREVAKSALNIQRGARRRCPVDTGRLRSSIQAQFYRGGLSAEVGSQVHYAAHVEFGTRPHFPPVRALRPWARRVLKDEGQAYPVARAIAERGTPERPYLFPAWEEERPRFEQAMRKAVGKDAPNAVKGT